MKNKEQLIQKCNLAVFAINEIAKNEIGIDFNVDAVLNGSLDDPNVKKEYDKFVYACMRIDYIFDSYDSLKYLSEKYGFDILNFIKCCNDTLDSRKLIEVEYYRIYLMYCDCVLASAVSLSRCDELEEGDYSIVVERKKTSNVEYLEKMLLKQHSKSKMHPTPEDLYKTLLSERSNKNEKE